MWSAASGSATSMVSLIAHPTMRRLAKSSLLLAQHGELTPQATILLLQRLAGQRRISSTLAAELLGPPSQQVGANIQLSSNLGQRDARRPPFRDQSHGLRFELVTECASFTTSCRSCVPVGFHVPPPPRT